MILTRSPFFTKPSLSTEAYHLDQPGFLISEILENSPNKNESEIFLQGVVGPVTLISDSPTLSINPDFIKLQSIPSIVMFSPVEPG